MEILDFIERRFPVDCNWTTGNCYYFAVILQARFPDGEIVYDPIAGHFLFRRQGRLYDYTGEVEFSTVRVVIEWSEFDNYDTAQKKVIERDCIR